MYESVYSSAFKAHSEFIVRAKPIEFDRRYGIEKDFFLAVKNETERNPDYKNMDYYKHIYRKVFDWHKKNAFLEGISDWYDLVLNFGQFNNSVQFEADLIVACVLEIERNLAPKLD
jgi:hypothetical protein